jgi:hypothetical protein
MKNFALLIALCAVSAAVGPQFASADTLTLTGTGSNQTNGVYTYPYYLSLDGSPSTDMMCLSFNNEITQGETWNVIPTAVTGNLDKEAAWLYADAKSTPANDINDQLAAWSLFASNVPMTAGSDTQLAAAIASINTETQAFYSQFTIYVPVGDPSAAGYPQTFISEAPEPWPLLMLGSGLLVLWGSRKLKVQHN